MAKICEMIRRSIWSTCSSKNIFHLQSVLSWCRYAMLCYAVFGLEFGLKVGFVVTQFPQCLQTNRLQTCMFKGTCLPDLTI